MRDVVKCCLGLLATFYAFEAGNLWNCKRNSEANQHTQLWETRSL